jgi:hypothetical protein
LGRGRRRLVTFRRSVSRLIDRLAFFSNRHSERQLQKRALMARIDYWYFGRPEPASDKPEDHVLKDEDDG